MERALAEITGMDAASLHPAAGAQGELAGLLIVRAHENKRGSMRRKVIIPGYCAWDESRELHAGWL